MEGDHGRVKDEESMLYKFFNKISFKLTAENCFDILKILLVFIQAFYVFKVNHAVALFSVIIICFCYLVCDIIITPEVEKKCRFLIERLENKLFPEKSKTQASVIKRNDAYNEVVKVLNAELIKQKKILRKQKEEQFCEKKELLKQLKKMEEEKEQLLKDLEDVRAQNKQMSIVTMGFDELWEVNEALKEDLDTEKELNQEMVERNDTLVKDIESERIAYKSWRERETTLRKKLEEEKEKLERDLEGKRGENTRLESYVKHTKYLIGEFVDYLQEEKNGNLNLKNLKEEMSSVIRFEIDKNNQGLSNELGQLRVLVEQKEVLKVEERCNKLETERDEMLKRVTKLEEERDNLVEENQMLLMENDADSSVAKILEEKFGSVINLLKEHIVTNGRKSEKLLENQDVMFKLLKEISGDDGYEVVGEI